ncbi:MAG: glycosyltransferase family 8 protein [Deferribacteraceae bacterium]|jgi:lipopolysaccharide biosynthesis glycosyltransferase|nr:glycosyltransferase family 8 protein [Deferribacteraceae bacterium]
MDKIISKKVNVAFCFDENMWMHAGVAITSLLLNSKGLCRYDIYCVISSAVSLPFRRELAELVKTQDPASTLNFVEANRDFDASYRSRYTIGTYYRMMLPRLLLNVDKVIYLDADMICCGPLSEIYEHDMTDYYIGGAPDIINTKSYWKKLQKGRLESSLRGGYVNAGFLLMNLKLIRESGLYEKWIEISKEKRYSYPDQDLFNVTCKDKILRMPLRYNFAVWTRKEYEEPIADGVFSIEEYEEAVQNPLILHYVPAKPWGVKVNMDALWWLYARKTPFYEYFMLDFITPKRVLKIGKLFSFIKVITVKVVGKNARYYLFGIIPLFRVKTVRI